MSLSLMEAMTSELSVALRSRVRAFPDWVRADLSRVKALHVTVGEMSQLRWAWEVTTGRRTRPDEVLTFCGIPCRVRPCRTCDC